MFNKLLNLFKKEEEVKPEPEKIKAEKPKTPRKPRKKKSEKSASMSAKELATAADEPYVSILRVDVDPTNINAGSFELDWNDKFVINLIKSGYKQREDDTDQVIVDRWFQTVCRNIALEVYEQNMADPQNRDGADLRRVQRTDLGNGRAEIS